MLRPPLLSALLQRREQPRRCTRTCLLEPLNGDIQIDQAATGSPVQHSDDTRHREATFTRRRATSGLVHEHQTCAQALCQNDHLVLSRVKAAQTQIRRAGGPYFDPAGKCSHPAPHWFRGHW